jgi:hypothetical protein
LKVFCNVHWTLWCGNDKYYNKIISRDFSAVTSKTGGLETTFDSFTP